MLLTTIFKAARPAFRSSGRLAMSTTNKPGPQKTWKERDSAQEKDFFNKEDGFI